MKSLTCSLGIALLLSIALVGRGIGAQPNPPAPKPEVESESTMVIGESSAKVVAPDLIKLLADPRWEVRLWAADILGKLGPEAHEAVPALSGLLQDGEPAVRQFAADALGQIGWRAEKAAPALAALLRDRTEVVRDAAAAALIKIGPGRARRSSRCASGRCGGNRLLADSCWDVRRLAADVLGGISRPPSGRHPGGRSRLTKLLADEEPAVRTSAAAALTAVSPKLDAALPLVEKLLRDAHPGVRALAAELLGKIGPAAKQSVPALSETLSDSEYRVRIAAARAWAKWVRRPAQLFRPSPRCCATMSPTFASRPWWQCR